MNIDSHYDVVIVGAGLVGASLAAMLAGDLRNAALKIALIDKQAAPVVPDIMAVSPRFDPRVLALTPRSEQLLHDLGAWPKIVAQRACVYQNMVVWDDEGTGQVEFDAHSLQQQALGTIVENSIALEAVLQRVQQYSQIHVLRGFAVADFTHRQQQVDVMLDDGRQLSTDLLVAADGAYSKIRQREGLSVREWSYQQQAIVTTVKTE
ncbi:MAG: FAD-dependent monooxygenase, partial [Cellvibrionaceae bacterium]|nr:FAD-dependent monooxygenase [Cellvibrionaceae bacterium]